MNEDGLSVIFSKEGNLSGKHDKGKNIRSLRYSNIVIDWMKFKNAQNIIFSNLTIKKWWKIEF
jgi:hypothetical protein